MSCERQHQHQSVLNVNAAAEEEEEDGEAVQLVRYSHVRQRNLSDGAAVRVRGAAHRRGEAGCWRDGWMTGWLSFASVTHNNAFRELSLFLFIYFLKQK